MTIHFGLDFDGPTHRGEGNEEASFFGPKSLTRWLETALGLGSRPDNTDYLRIELYRQSLAQNLRERGAAFYQKSFEADRFATAQALLEWRDELLLVASDDWRTAISMVNGGRRTADEPDSDGLSRLRDLAAVESFFLEKTNDAALNPLALGWADRLDAVIQSIENQRFAFDKVFLHEPFELLPAVWRRLFSKLKKGGTAVEPTPADEIERPTAVLDFLQKKLRQPAAKAEPPANPVDTSTGLFILKAENESAAATFFAQFLAKNPGLRPVFLVPELSRSLDAALAREGLPAMGVASASLARPSLQLLKLAPAFLWEPVDVAKLLEFATLPLKPLDEGLSLLIAKLLAEKPGLGNDPWLAATRDFFENCPPEISSSIKREFDFWFARRRRPQTDDVPKRDVAALYDHLTGWASTTYEQTGGRHPSLLTLTEQARRIRELLDALPEQRLGFLEIERIVRTIYQPAPLPAGGAEVGHFAYAHQPGGLAGAADDLVWWDFSHSEPPRFANRWAAAERLFFENLSAETVGATLPLDTAERQNRLNRLRQIQPVLRARRRLFLVAPKKIAGEDVQPNLLMGDLEAIFGKSLHQFEFDLSTEEGWARLGRFFKMPGEVFLEKGHRRRPGPFVELRRPEALRQPDYETPTSLENLFYYPHQWFLRSKARLRPAPILSVTGENTLLGNLAHRFFEELLREEFYGFDQKTVDAWVNRTAPQLFEKEGAAMLLYGREPERAAFLAKIRRSAWSLISLIKENHWRVAATEQQLDGLFCGLPIRGKADLVLARGDERAVVDLKWAGFNRRRELIRNREDLQLTFYSKLVEPVEVWAHTAYFVLEDAKMVARNAHAFTRATAADDCPDHSAIAQEIFEKMERTFRWRMAQVEAGRLEIRTKESAAALEGAYEGQLFDLLEMRQESARWDDFRVLIG